MIYEPYQLCCALNELAARCIVCKKDFCAKCFMAFHARSSTMYCGQTQLYWKNLTVSSRPNPEHYELHPLEK